MSKTGDSEVSKKVFNMPSALKSGSILEYRYQIDYTDEELPFYARCGEIQRNYFIHERDITNLRRSRISCREATRRRAYPLLTARGDRSTAWCGGPSSPRAPLSFRIRAGTTLLT